MTDGFHALPADLTYAGLLPYLRASLDAAAQGRSLHLCAMTGSGEQRHTLSESDRAVILALDREAVGLVLRALLLVGNEATAVERSAGSELGLDLPEYWSDVRFADVFARMARSSSTLLFQNFSRGEEYMLVALLHRAETVRRFRYHLAAVRQSQIEQN